MPNVDRPLVLVDRHPLPLTSGGRHRMWHFLTAVDRGGRGDLVVIGGAEPHPTPLPLAGWTVTQVGAPRRDLGRAAKLATLVGGRVPLDLAKLDLAAIAASIEPLAGDRSLVVGIQPLAAEILTRLPGDGRSLVDFWDVDMTTISERLAGSGAGIRQQAQRAACRIRRSRERASWARLHRRVLERVSVVTVCSALERQLLPAIGQVEVIENGATERPFKVWTPSEPPVVLFHGQLTYAPNADAAEQLVERIAPELVRRGVEAQIRLVGRADARVERLHRPPLVDVTGFVDDIDAELASARVVAVPLRSGGGTRLKILEAFAAGVPVVSTRVGAEGLAVVDGEHLLLADEPADFAAALQRVIQDPELATALVARGRDLVASRYSWRLIEDRLAEVLESLEPRG